jgi:Spy/CpxP family protein refolding chaperone
MVKQKTYRLLVWAVIILLATNISMAVSFLVHKKQDQNNLEKQEQAAIEVPTEQRTKFFKEQLSLLPGQMDPFREFNRNYNRATNAVAHKLEVLRVEMVGELGKENPDKNRLNEITAEIGNLHKDLKNITIEYYQQMNNICDASQRKKLNGIFMSMVNKNDEVNPQQRGRRNRFGNR